MATTDSGKNVVVADQLEALAIAAKNYTQNEIARGGISVATFTLDTVPSTVEGAMWLDNSSDEKLVIYHNNQHYYFPLAVLPKILSVNVAPSSATVMQGQSATATVSAIGNEAVTGLSYGLSGAPTWITISDDVILIQPSDNDLGIAQVEVYAQDTGSDAMSSAMLRAEALLRPIIESLSIIPPAVTVQQGQSAVAGISAVANDAVTGLSYSINGASSWISLFDDSIIVAPTNNDLGSNTVDVIAYDTNSSASAATQFVATAALRPIISSVSVNPPTVAAIQGQSTTATISAVANEAVTGLSYSLDGNPDWMNLSGSVILMTPTKNDSGSAAVTVTARDTGSSASAATVFNAETKELLPEITGIAISAITPSLYAYGIPAFFYDQKATVTLTAEHNAAAKNITFTSRNNSQFQVTITGNVATVEAVNQFKGQGNLYVKAVDETGRAQYEKFLQLFSIRYFHNAPSISPASSTLVSGNSGYATVRTTLQSDNLTPLEVYQGKPFYKGLQISYTGNAGLATLSCKYPKNIVEEDPYKQAVNIYIRGAETDKYNVTEAVIWSLKSFNIGVAEAATLTSVTIPKG